MGRRISPLGTGRVMSQTGMQADCLISKNSKRWCAHWLFEGCRQPLSRPALGRTCELGRGLEWQRGPNASAGPRCLCLRMEADR